MFWFIVSEGFTLAFVVSTRKVLTLHEKVGPFRVNSGQCPPSPTVTQTGLAGPRSQQPPLSLLKLSLRKRLVCSVTHKYMPEPAPAPDTPNVRRRGCAKPDDFRKNISTCECEEREASSTDAGGRYTLYQEGDLHTKKLF